MKLIPENKQLWGQIKTYNWEELNPYLWGSFRLVLMQTETEQESTGISLDISSVKNTTLTEMKSNVIRVQISSVVINTDTEMAVNIIVTERDYKKSMLEYLPHYERESRVFNELLDSYDKELRFLEQNLQIVDRNMFIDTTIEGLSLLERDMGITNSQNLSYNDRREQISSTSMSVFDQTTEDTIKMISMKYGGGDVELNKTPVAGIYDISFVDKGIPKNLSGLKNIIDKIAPAHLQFNYVFVFITWSQANQKKWVETANTSWQEFIEMESVI